MTETALGLIGAEALRALDAAVIALWPDREYDDEEHYVVAWRRKARHQQQPQDADGWTYGTHYAAVYGGARAALTSGHYELRERRDALADMLDRAAVKT